MVDALQPGAPRLADSPAERPDSLPLSPRSFSVAPFEDAFERYAALCAGAIHAAHQDPLWLSAWAKQTGAEMVAITLGDALHPQMMVVLEIVRRGPFRIARFPGGRHAAGNFPAASRSFLAVANSRAASAALPGALHASRPDIDLLSLERLEPARGGQDNPLLAIATGTSPNIALALDLSGGFEAVLARTNGKRKLKKHRAQSRKFDAAGGYRLVRAGKPEEVDALLSAFYVMKAERFRRMGIRNVFAGREVQAFFRELFREALDTPQPRFVLHGLEVGGKLRAVTGCSILGDRMTCDFSAITEDELASASPGDFLFFEDIREACRNGLAVFDFSVGDEPYKRLWCDIETHQQDVFLPLSRKGRALAFFQQELAVAKRAVKENPVVWAAVKRLRRGVAGNPPLPRSEKTDPET